MTAKKLIANKLGVSPKAIWVPITGGASPSTLVPIIVGARPGGVFLSVILNLSYKFKSMPFKCKKDFVLTLTSEVNFQ